MIPEKFCKITIISPQRLPGEVMDRVSEALARDTVPKGNGTHIVLSNGYNEGVPSHSTIALNTRNLVQQGKLPLLPLDVRPAGDWPGTVRDYLVTNQGFSAEGASGVASALASHSDSMGRGIAGWQGERERLLTQFAQANGGSVDDIRTQ